MGGSGHTIKENVEALLVASEEIGLDVISGRPDAERDGTRAETRIGLSAKRTSPFISAGGSVQSTAGSRGVRISGSNGSNAGYTVF